MYSTGTKSPIALYAEPGILEFLG